MKKLINLLMIVGLVVGVGCALTPQEAAHKTLGGIGLAVQKSMQAAAQAKMKGKISDAQWSTVRDIHDNKYLPAYILAVDVASYDFNSYAPSDVLRIASDINILVTSLTK